MTSPISEPVDPPKTELGYVTTPTPSWSYFGTGAPAGDEMEDVPALRWPLNIRLYHKMRTDSQIDSLISAVTMPLMRLNWMINPNGARDEVVQDISTQLNLPVLGDADEYVARGRKRFNHSEHLRMALLAPTVYGHMFFEMIGNIINSPGTPEHLAWKLSKLSPRMPQSISKIDVATDGGLIDIVQFNGTGMGNYKGIPIPVSQLVAYPWQKEGGNWTGRSMMRPLYRPWLLKDRMLRVDAIKNERFGAGIPTGTAPTGGDPADYSKLAQGIRASESGGVGLPNGASIGIEGIKGTLPDTLASIQLYNEEMARSFLAMFVNLGSTQSGSRALGEQFVNFFVDALAAFANWYMTITNEHVIEDIVDWNYGVDEQAPLLVWQEREEEPLGVEDLANLVKSGALVVDAEMQTWIRKQYEMPEYKGDAPLPTKPATPIQINPAGDPAEPPGDTGEVKVVPLAASAYVYAMQAVDCPTCSAVADEPCVTRTGHLSGTAWCHSSRVAAHVEVESGGTPSKGTPADKRLKENKPKPKVKITKGAAVCGSSQTVNSDNVGHREPNANEVAAGTDFAAHQQAWQKSTTSVVDDWQSVRTSQIAQLVKDVTAAVKAGDSTALANLSAPVLGSDVILKHMKSAATTALSAAKKEAKDQGITAPATAVADLGLEQRADAVAALLARGLGQSAANNALMRYGTDGVSAADVAAGVKDKLEALTDSYLNDTLGGAITQAQNTARRAVINAARTPATKVYSSELLDENTCEECSAEDGTVFGSMDDADEAYPTGGFIDCLGGPRCRGTLVAVYGEDD